MNDQRPQYRFMVKGTGLDGEEAFAFHWVINSPDDALQLTLNNISKLWSGGIEVHDLESLANGQMPLIDYWKEPSGE
jgi:hypothetical protein